MPCAFRDQAALTWNPAGDTQLPAGFSSCLAWLQLGENLKKSRKFYIIRILKSCVYQVWFRFVVCFVFSF